MPTFTELCTMSLDELLALRELVDVALRLSLRDLSEDRIEAMLQAIDDIDVAIWGI